MWIGSCVKETSFTILTKERMALKMCDSPFGVHGNMYEEEPGDSSYDSGCYEEGPDDSSYDGGHDEKESSEEFIAQLNKEYLAKLASEVYAAGNDIDLLPSSDSDDDDYETSDFNSTSVAIAPDQQWLQSVSSGKRAQRLFGLAKEVVEAGTLLITETGQAFVYDETGGYFRPISNLPAYIAGFFPEEIMSSLLARDVHEIEEQLSWNSLIRCDPDGFNHCPEMVNLENGVFNLKISELLPHGPNFRFTYQIHARYLESESDVNCPTFERFCVTSLEGDPKKRLLLLEFIGYICTDTNDGKCAMFLKGQPNSGKSVIASFITRLFDPEQVSNVPLHQLGDRFFKAELFGKKLNAAGEIAGRALRDISIFKSVTGNDRIAGEFKGHDPFYFTSRCKLLFSGNTLPLTTELDTTKAFVNRIRVLLFNTSVPLEEQDKQLLEKLWDKRDSIITLALHAAQALMERNYEFTLPEDSKKFLDAFSVRGNVVQGFIEER